jgi:hypothetical protein
MQALRSMTPAQRGLAYLAGWSIFTLMGGICVFVLVYFALAPRTPTGSEQSRATPTSGLQVGVPTLIPTAVISPTLVGATQSPVATVGQITVISVTSPATRGTETTLQIQTQPLVACAVEFYSPDGTRLNKNKLADTAADANGVCAWTWILSEKAIPGTGKLVVISAGQTLTVDFEIR